MKTKIIIVMAALCLAIFGLIATRSGSVAQQQSREQQIIEDQRGTLAERAQRARARGQRRLVISTPIVPPARVRDLDQALSYFTVVVAEPIEQRTYPHDQYDLISWYRFRVVENLTPETHTGCLLCSDIEIPNELLPVNEDEILVPRYGGTLMLDGIEVVQLDRRFPQFIMGQRYLLFLSLDTSRRMGIMQVGPDGTFAVNNGNLQAITNREHPIRGGLATQHGNSLERLRAHIRARQ